MQKVEQLKKRFVELADKAYTQNLYTYTGFLNMMEQDIFYQVLPLIPHVPYQLFGGEDFCERQMIGFGSCALFGYQGEFPISCLHVYPVSFKYADMLAHRDFLGALLNLGIERSTIGDIFVKNKEAYLYCQKNMSDYIITNLDRIHHTSVKVEMVETELTNDWKPVLKSESMPVSSFRLDVVIAAVYHLSRKQSLEYLQEKKIFVNGRCIQNPSHILQEGDLISVRGQGRFWFRKIGGETKKGKFFLTIEKYR
ncbi:YlmH family RNA-binding protein [Anaerosacchariphilus polymeriproducens]|uniref:RNA-binding S4 domain-containing protein n=1 Tax=Anaerosacchariphilus polymeriproducens TaxID=1812858 RepID=A0A371AT83_9FIRM|nr:YlmH/Sll1252 family protein [Anaerosacchariphilus polymeriproducens]RDU22787.1 hypothetical protein DWV06_12620 [Anaerosacchariphilus polymeriproducens]